jgi:hypothetical protein
MNSSITREHLRKRQRSGNAQQRFDVFGIVLSKAHHEWMRYRDTNLQPTRCARSPSRVSEHHPAPLSCVVGQFDVDRPVLIAKADIKDAIGQGACGRPRARRSADGRRIGDIGQNGRESCLQRVRRVGDSLRSCSHELSPRNARAKTLRLLEEWQFGAI